MDDEEKLAMSNEDRLRLVLMSTQIELDKALVKEQGHLIQIAKQRSMLEQMKAQLATISLDQQRQQLDRQHERHFSSMQEALKEVGDKYGVDFDEYGYDPDTGLIDRLP